jgi:tol-pal system protein YbgF
MDARSIVKMKGFAHTAAHSVLVTLCATFLACGGGRNKAENQLTGGDESDIDQLLSTSEQQKRQSAEEQEVLRLLGIAPDDQANDSSRMAPAAESQTEAASADEVQRLERELQDRDQQIAILRNELASQERRLQELQTERARPVKIATRQQTAGGVSANYRSAYEKAMSLYNGHNYRDALASFANLLSMDDKNSLADNAQYWMGECYYALGNYNQAVAEFQKVLSFTRSNKSDAALLKLGLCYIRLGDRDQARSELEQLIVNFPRSEYVGKARNFLAAADGR